MKVETPQILWNAEAEKGKNAPLLSIDLLESGFADPMSTSTNDAEFSHVLVTAGNATSINLWKVTFTNQASMCNGEATNSGPSNCSDGIYHRQTRPLNNIEYMLSLTRHDVAVNTVAFSPDGLHLATAGDSGNIVVWSVPVHKRGNNNGRHFWSTLTKENELTVRIISTHCEGIVDISWSSDSKRFAVGTIDSCLLIYEDKHFGINACNPETHQKESEWSQVFRNAEHGSFVQGVSYDPLGVYIASMGSDRTVRVFPRKTPPKSKKKVLRPANASDGNNIVTPPQEHQRMVAQLLMESKVEIGKTKRIKQRLVTSMEVDGPAENQQPDQSQSHVTQERQVKHKLFVDESNCESFFRRLSWTSDGAFLVTPAALWHANINYDSEKQQMPANNSGEDDSCYSPSFSTYLFARHKFDEPYRVLAGLDKPSVVVRPNPVLFELPPKAMQDSKENQSPMQDDDNNDRSPSACGLPYRSIFAVLTLDSVLIYDTYHIHPLSVIQGLHYAGLTDCCWSSDGKNLMISSSDGYISIVNFSEGELGKVYTRTKLSSTTSTSDIGTTRAEVIDMPPPVSAPPLPPCESGPANVVVAPPPKRAKKMRITPTLISVVPMSEDKLGSPKTNVSSSSSNPNAHVSNSSKRGISDTETETVGAAVTKLSLDTATVSGSKTNMADTVDSSPTNTETGSGEKPKKKKKRLQPLLISGIN
ncbi:WD-40 repeat-containing protein [Nitzschia inconspicua]|uniref:WD-40 repeat-containing protein n=1 Tax=Nitzschia inconspicua TaxID=303405 RepID=A0A9K3L6X4_9STRA|nr:WD-40 repeat-containing protein [Nitzschia inconspicua]